MRQRRSSCWEALGGELEGELSGELGGELPTRSDELDGVDALLVSPVLAPRKGREALGPSALGELGEQLRARHQAYPLYALGGVTATNAAACLAAGERRA